MSLLAITLEIILYITLHRAMGRNFSGVWASSSLGIRARKVEFRDMRIELERLESSTTSQTSILTVGQQAF